MSISLKDVAAAAGVSVATVSRALGHTSGSSIRVSPETRKRVLAASDRLGYRPHRLARSLKRGRTNTIGLIVPRLGTLQAAEFVDAVWEVCAEHDYRVLLGYSRHDAKIECEQAQLLSEHRVDGIIVLLSARGGYEYREWIDHIRKERVACVVVRERVRNAEVNFVGCDIVGGAREAVTHLINLGHRRIGHICGQLDATSGKDRLQGYKEALAAAGIPFDEALVVGGWLSEQSAAEAMAALLDLPDPPTAVFAVNDFLAVAAMRVIQERGLRVPQDLAVVGFGDVHWSDALGLTSVHEPVDQMGRCAASRLLEALADADSPSRSIILPTHLVVRASCGATGGFMPLVGATGTWETGETHPHLTSGPVPIRPGVSEDMPCPKVPGGREEEFASQRRAAVLGQQRQGGS